MAPANYRKGHAPAIARDNQIQDYSKMIKGVAKAIMPERIYRPTSASWRICRHHGGRFIWFARIRYKMGLPETLFHFGIGPGDDLLCTVVLRELRKRGRKNIWLMSKNGELFERNPDVDRVVPIDDRFREYVITFGQKWQPLEYAPRDLEKDWSEPPKRHIIAELCARAGVRGEITARPYFYLQEEERAAAGWAKDMVAIQSSGLGGQWPMQNKQWIPERFQQVVSSFKGKLQFVQLGSASDPALQNVVDLRGKTTMRNTAAVLANCRVFLGNVGFLMHLARAVECPSVIVFGGREAPWQSGYSCNVNLYSSVPCAPCWLWNKCDFKRVCMEMITADEVIDGVKVQAERPRGKLAVDNMKVL